MKIFYSTNKSLPADIHVRIRRGVVQIPIRDSQSRTIVPITTEEGKHTSQNPKNYTLGVSPQTPPKEVF